MNSTLNLEVALVPYFENESYEVEELSEKDVEELVRYYHYRPDNLDGVADAQIYIDAKNRLKYYIIYLEN